MPPNSRDLTFKTTMVNDRVLGPATFGEEDRTEEPDEGSARNASQLPRAMSPMPGELSQWAAVSKHVGLLIPGRFSAPAPGPQDGSHPSLTSTRSRVAVENPDGTYDIRDSVNEWFLHAFPCQRIHAIHPTAARTRGLYHAPSAWASAVGQAGTCTRFKENLVVTALHLWERLCRPDNRSQPRGDVFVVFDHEDDSPPISARGSDTEATDRPDYGGWGRTVRTVFKVIEVRASAAGSNGEQPVKTYLPEEDWVVLKIMQPYGERPPSEPDPVIARTFKTIGANHDWVNGYHDTEDRYVMGHLTTIGHPLGVSKKIADKGKPIEWNGRLFRHNLDSFGGNSGSPIFRPASGGEERGLWLVGMNLGGRELVQLDGYLVPASTDPDLYGATENLAIDLRAVKLGDIT